MLKIIQNIDGHARYNPAAPAICSKANIVTYTDLRNAIINICAKLDSLGAKRGSKAYLNIRGADLRFAATLACLHYGVVPFILSRPSEVPGQVDFDLVISAERSIVPDIPGNIEVDGSVFGAAQGSIGSWGASEWEPDELIAVSITSGSTGTPKLLAITFRQFVTRLGNQSLSNWSGRTMSTFGGYQVWSFFMLNRIISGGGIQVRSDLNPVTTLRLINLFLVDRLVTSPKTMETLIAAMAETGIKCPSIEQISLGGSRFDPPLLPAIERMFKAEIRYGYGTSETGLISSAIINSTDYEPGYVGEIKSPLELVTVPNEETGQQQFRVRNDIDYVLRSYRDGKVITDEDDNYLIPDLGHIEGERVFVAGRADEVYNLSGTKYSFGKLEEVVASIANVDEVAVVRDPDDPDPFGIKIAVAGQDGVDFFNVMDQLCKRLKRRNARKHICLYDLPDLPRNASGKIDRPALLAQLKQTPAVNA